MRHLLRRLLGRRTSRLADAARGAVERQRGIEVGGPSRIFTRKGRIPLYPVVAALDGSDFGIRTRWRPGRDPEAGYVWDPKRPAGRLFLCEAADLEPVDSASYDFVLASHVLEHTANPLGALDAWHRVLRPGGALVLVVPHREGTFDHRRDVTDLEHLEADLEAGTKEDDPTHVPEVLALHDLTRDPGVSSRDQLEQRSLANAENRCLHHHVFDTSLVLRALDRTGWAICAVDVMRPYHIVVLATRPIDDAPLANGTFLATNAVYRHLSPFPGDR